MAEVAAASAVGAFEVLAASTINKNRKVTVVALVKTKTSLGHPLLQ